MTEFPQHIKFKYSWRKYQQRVLDELQEHLEDGHLHVIAPPGSGKTILGLEVMLRINQPTLILAPTIAIRNQWVQRFCELFLQTNRTPEWISTDIRNPLFLTVTTYQGLHAACGNLDFIEDEMEPEVEEDEEQANGKFKADNPERVVKLLKAQNIKTIIVDEAHHLKSEWWHTLTKVKEQLCPTIVGLTATPPYDVSYSEWQRYIELNGPVDTEISVPELVIEGDLCPHQDYVFFSLPTDLENQKIIEFRNNIEKLFQEIKNDELLLKAFEFFPAWMNPSEHFEWIYTNVSCYSAMLIFLKANAKEISKLHLNVIGDNKPKIPELDYTWMETILEFYLYSEEEHFDKFKDQRKEIENKLRRAGAIEKKQVRFENNKKVNGFLTSSISKLSGIKRIVDFEYQQLGDELRLVILTDFIRKEFFIDGPDNNIELNKVGVGSIFEKLRRKNQENIKIGVLTGSIVIIPISAYKEFERKIGECSVGDIDSSLLPFDSNYILIEQTEELKKVIVQTITQIFQQGGIEVLIGTKSLLGEGWDAPAINSLILASFVGSFVLSNQMRGRAIRIQRDNDNKTGNIWHLVCVDPTSPTGGEDLELLKRRFKSFVGVSFADELGIENGVERLKIPVNVFAQEDIENSNQKTFEYAGNRDLLKQSWQKALETGVRLVEEIKIPFGMDKTYKETTTLYLTKTIAYLIATLFSGLTVFAEVILNSFAKFARNIETSTDVFIWLSIIGVFGVTTFGGLAFKTFKLYLKYRDISKDIHQIGEALLNSLIAAKVIHTEVSHLNVTTSSDRFGAVYCHLEGGTTFEKSAFINALREIIGTVDNPRYIIIRKSWFIVLIKQQDYHSVPDVIGRHKDLAEYFKTQWQRFVGNCELIFTRNPEGRRFLLRSRIRSLAAQFEKGGEQINKWR